MFGVIVLSVMIDPVVVVELPTIVAGIFIHLLPSHPTILVSAKFVTPEELSHVSVILAAVEPLMSQYSIVLTDTTPGATDVLV